MIEVFVVSTDLANRRPVVSNGGEFIANAIVDSCALPFLIRVWNKTAGPIRVDGGSAENLPTSPLNSDNSTHGELVAVSFPLVLPEPPIGFAKFSLALLDSSISSSIAQTRSRMHRNSILELRTGLSTFSFREALSSGLGGEYENIKKDTRQWLDEFIREKKSGVGVTKIDPWNDPNPTTQILLGQMTNLYHSLFRKSLLKYIRCRFSVTVNSLRTKDVGDIFENNPDIAEFELKFMAGSEVVQAIAMSVVEQKPGETQFAGDTAECHFTNEAGDALKFQAIPTRDPQTPTSRQLAIFFDPPLAPGSGPYTLVFREDARNLMPDLLNTGIEPISYSPERADGPIERVELVLYTPKKAKVFMSPQVSEGPVLGRPMSTLELASCKPPHGDLQAHGWIVDSLDKPEIAVNVLYPKSGKAS